ncbi:MAG: hypothetical protein U0893_09090 [Chloroflexota bacterium]
MPPLGDRVDVLAPFRTRRWHDPALGALARRWGRWHGQIVLGGDDRDGGGTPSTAGQQAVLPTVPLVLAGGRSAPDPALLQLARDLHERYAALLPALERAFFEHYQPYAEAVLAGEEPPSDHLPTLTAPTQVWPHVTPVRVLLDVQRGAPTVEIAYRVAWDEEHTLGARFQNWQLVELNGSVLV